MQKLTLTYEYKHESRDLRIGNFLRIESRIESNQGVVVYMFNADCHRSYVLLNEVIIIIIITEMCIFSRFLK